jgi:hypothetical protein
MATSQNICNSYFQKLKSEIALLEKLVGGKIIFFDGELNPNSAYHLHKVIRKLNGEKLFLILESPGGQIDTAAKIVHICNEYFKEFNVVVPSYAKSAATLICLAADNLFLGKAGELGPIDPQVKHPIENGLYFPALAIKDAIEFIESSNDPFVKIGLTEKIDPYLMGAYKRVLKLAEQYLESANLVKNSKSSKEIIKSLTQKYISHGYPIDISECKHLGIKTTFFKKEAVLENIYDIFEEYVDFLIDNKIEMELLIMSSNICVEKIKENPPPAEIQEIEELLEPKKETDEKRDF